MTDGENEINPVFLQLVVSLQSAAWYQMGKMVSPITGKIERDLTQAKNSIDLLVMLQEKTKGNLADDEKGILDNAIYTLQMNYVEELDREKKEKDSGKVEGDQAKSGNEAKGSGPDSMTAGN